LLSYSLGCGLSVDLTGQISLAELDVPWMKILLEACGIVVFRRCPDSVHEQVFSQSADVSTIDYLQREMFEQVYQKLERSKSRMVHPTCRTEYQFTWNENDLAIMGHRFSLDHQPSFCQLTLRKIALC
jgi:hypothetical protein